MAALLKFRLAFGLDYHAGGALVEGEARQFLGGLHGRRKRILTYPILVSMAQVIVCVGGMLGGLTIGVVIIVVSGLWGALDRVLIAPTDSMSLFNFGLSFVTVAIVVICGWFGIRLGMDLAQHIG